MKKIELLAPAGDLEKLQTAIYFGADAVYFGGPDFGLRCQSVLDWAQLETAARTAKALARKAYVTVNFFARDRDFGPLTAYLERLAALAVDGIIVSDLGVMELIRERFPTLPLHVSTQSNTLNSWACRVYERLGVERIVLARELTLTDIKEFRQNLSSKIELEAFVHGAMCMSYSGRCLLSNYLSGRESNRGACVQACRWRFEIRADGHEASPLLMEEDGRSTYILNSKDLNTLAHLGELIDAGVTSFKIEGRNKTAYYVATVTNAYRRALDLERNGKPLPEELALEPGKASNRGFTTGFYFADKTDLDTINERESKPNQTCEMIAVVTEETKDGFATVEMRNRFAVGQTAEVLSPHGTFGQKIHLEKILAADGQPLLEVKRVQEHVKIATELTLRAGDMLRRENV